MLITLEPPFVPVLTPTEELLWYIFDEVIYGLVFRFALSFVLIFKHQKKALVCMLSRIGICASVLGGSLRYENAKQISLPALLWAKLLWAQWGVARHKHNL